MCVCKRVGCFGLCNEAIGCRLVKFLNEIDTEDIMIGEQSIPSETSGYLTIIGALYYKDSETSNVLKPLSKIKFIPSVKRFNQRGDLVNKPEGLPAVKLIDNFCKYFPEHKELGDRSKKVLIGIDNNKKVLMPIKPDRLVTMRVVYNDVYGMKTVENTLCKVDYVRWALDVDNNSKLQCIIYGKTERGGKIVHNDLEEYGKTLIQKVNDSTSKCEYHEDIVKMSSFGYVKTVVIKHGKNMAVIDNCSLYYKDRQYLKEIGIWQGDSLSDLDSVTDPLIRKVITDNLRYLSSHRRWIVPYSLGQSIEINIPEGE